MSNLVPLRNPLKKICRVHKVACNFVNSNSDFSCGVVDFFFFSRNFHDMKNDIFFLKKSTHKKIAAEFLTKKTKTKKKSVTYF